MIAAVPLMVNEVEILRQVEALEQDLRLAQVRQRHADLADLRARHGMGRVVAALRRQVERDGQTGLALLQQELVALVGFLGRAEAGVLADGPQPALVAVGEDAAGERVLARLADVLGFTALASTWWVPGCRCGSRARARVRPAGGMGLGSLVFIAMPWTAAFRKRPSGRRAARSGPDGPARCARCACQPAPWRAAMACALMPRSTCGAQALQRFQERGDVGAVADRRRRGIASPQATACSAPTSSQRLIMRIARDGPMSRNRSGPPPQADVMASLAWM